MMLIAWAASLVTITVGRAIHSRVQRSLQRRGVGAERVLIVGTGEVGRMILQKIQHAPGLGYQVVGFVETAAETAIGPDGQCWACRSSGMSSDLPRIIEDARSTR